MGRGGTREGVVGGLVQGRGGVGGLVQGKGRVGGLVHGRGDKGGVVVGGKGWVGWMTAAARGGG